MNETQDRKHYLADLISLYTEQLERPIASTFGELIKEELKKCFLELELIKQVDLEAMLLAKSRNTKGLLSQSVFPFTNWT